MSTQPKALRLADALEDSLEDYSGSSLPRRCQSIADEAATELRRLHALNQEVLAALKQIASGQYVEGEEQEIARAAIIKATGEQK